MLVSLNVDRHADGIVVGGSRAVVGVFARIVSVRDDVSAMAIAVRLAWVYGTFFRHIESRMRSARTGTDEGSISGVGGMRDVRWRSACGPSRSRTASRFRNAT